MAAKEQSCRYRPVNGQVGDPLVSQAVDLIWAPSQRRLSVGQIAEHLPASRRTLERRFRLWRGHSILDEIITCRLTRAERLLRETDLPVKTVAYLAGFTGPERMRVAFVKTTGTSPVRFRQRTR